jgi:hypothetical protein
MRMATSSRSKKALRKVSSVHFKWPMVMARSMTRPSIWWNMGVWVASLSPTIDAARSDDAQRRAERLHGSDLHRRGVRAQHARLLARDARVHVEGVVHRPGRVGLGHVEGGEIMPLVLDLRPFGDGKAQIGKDFRELVHDLG